MPSIQSIPYGAVIAIAAACLAGCAHKATNERVTGECSVALVGKCSSKQVTTDLTDAEKAQLAPLQTRRLGMSVMRALSAAQAALKADGYEQVSVNTTAGLVQAEKSHSLSSQGSKLVRAVLNAKMPMLRAKPDHETTRALVTVQPSGDAAMVHVEFVTTVWDSKGDAKTHMATEPDTYNGFFARMHGARP
ncbi:hypothetical protein JQ557_01205 [Bradyrhizobium sp. U87765 SZCCT0131]|uniref:hypothetical protein n=1 Tax=unclassified Bradyrhizobium TaxID=2631580 RepID=UPI001BAAA04A|nr:MULTISPECIES: hypothetical protein [unclassified Bradyrhizobium]MBR1216591.1 hypothetical protein [Bradyrhizobium sp. U87765 SZCCT0131]MBR1259653.1 hypothetical protein [Bradyrhizobium sp. U87765 SZCCT0134]MBR1305794.1 hypothetical protein [Bradyrhizobium sp. U87765 SZCCT0110]MBR1322161.1 hypothetical protein [Bradyrhizobium sp. U87765 SZCCT0109]MBR1350560.1 hypothetical protein [Bradyrhizobium sp. U87765 SZCCT0048]